MSRRLSRHFVGVLSAFLLSLMASSALAQSQPEAGVQDPYRPEREIRWKLDRNRDSNPNSVYAEYYSDGDLVVESKYAGVSFAYFYGTKGNGAVYWTKETGAVLVFGVIEKQYEQMDFETGIGVPTSDPQYGRGGLCTDPNVVRWQQFSKTPASVPGTRTSATVTYICEKRDGSIYVQTLVL